MVRCPRCGADLNPITSHAVCPSCLSRQSVRAPLRLENVREWRRRDPVDRRRSLQAAAARSRLQESRPLRRA